MGVTLMQPMIRGIYKLGNWFKKTLLNPVKSLRLFNKILINDGGYEKTKATVLFTGNNTSYFISTISTVLHLLKLCRWYSQVSDCDSKRTKYRNAVLDLAEQFKLKSFQQTKDDLNNQLAKLEKGNEEKLMIKHQLGLLYLCQQDQDLLNKLKIIIDLTQQKEKDRLLKAFLKADIDNAISSLKMRAKNQVDKKLNDLLEEKAQKRAQHLANELYDQTKRIQIERVAAAASIISLISKSKDILKFLGYTFIEKTWFQSFILFLTIIKFGLYTYLFFYHSYYKSILHPTGFEGEKLYKKMGWEEPPSFWQGIRCLLVIYYGDFAGLISLFLAGIIIPFLSLVPTIITLLSPLPFGWLVIAILPLPSFGLYVGLSVASFFCVIIRLISTLHEDAEEKNTAKAITNVFLVGAGLALMVISTNVAGPVIILAFTFAVGSSLTIYGSYQPKEEKADELSIIDLEQEQEQEQEHHKDKGKKRSKSEELPSDVDTLNPLSDDQQKDCHL
jgi:hypothetical protein